VASNRAKPWCTVSATHTSPPGVNAMPRGSWKIAVSVGGGMTSPIVLAYAKPVAVRRHRSMRFPHRSAAHTSPEPSVAADTRRMVVNVPGVSGSPNWPNWVTNAPPVVNTWTRLLRPSAT
jgi:hypothetical protein